MNRRRLSGSAVRTILTGNHINREAIVEVLQKFQGIVIIDEAYSDFSSERTLP